MCSNSNLRYKIIKINICVNIIYINILKIVQNIVNLKKQRIYKYFIRYTIKSDNEIFRRSTISSNTSLLVLSSFAAYHPGA